MAYRTSICWLPSKYLHSILALSFLSSFQSVARDNGWKSDLFRRRFSNSYSYFMYFFLLFFNFLFSEWVFIFLHIFYSIYFLFSHHFFIGWVCRFTCAVCRQNVLTMTINQHCQKAVGVFKCITATHIFLYIKLQKCKNTEQRFYSLQNNILYV